MIKVPSHIIKEINKRYSSYYSQISRIPIHKITEDAVASKKAECQAEILTQYTSLYNKNVLEVGAGFGINLSVWYKQYGINYFGIEPDGEGFDCSFNIAHMIFKANGLDPERIINATGENIPFAGNYFDIVYSTNVLEHVANPVKVLDESLRVLKPGGVMQFVYPNYHSFYDGHYAVFHPSIYFKSFFPWYVKYIWGRDPAFAKTLRTELNLNWTKKTLKKLNNKYSFNVLSLGQEIFMERMINVNFESWGGLTKVKQIVETAKKLKLNILAGKIMIAIKAWSPIILTLKKM